MKLVPMLDLLRPALAHGYAVPSFCVWNAETIRAVLEAAQQMRSPVILMNGPAEFGVLRPAEIADTARALAARFDIPAALHLDHGSSLDDVHACLSAGYTSVMLDYSARPYDENVAGLSQTVTLARPRGVTVEGELGHVGRVDSATTEGTHDSTLTEPAEAARFVEQTGVDALAVSIGNAHGQYTRLPKLDFDRLAAIHRAVEIPLVLHGGSGTPAEDLRRAISLGIAKVNVATELVSAIRESLRSNGAPDRNPWLPLALAEATASVRPVLEKWILATGSGGRA